jgi:hypothetical protein
MRVFVFLLIGMLSTGCALAQPASSKYTIRVVNTETLLPITNAIVRTGFEHQYDPWGNKPSIIDRRKEHANQDGEVTFTGKSLQGGAGGTAFAEGYYSGNNGIEPVGKNLALNRWEPWNPTIEIKLRPKKNPVLTVYTRVERKMIPVWETPVGFDLEIGDWVAPHGEGRVSDFIFKAAPETDPKEGIRYSIAFPHPLDGIQEYIPSENLQSEYVFPYLAPTSGYASVLKRYRLLKYPVLPDYPANNLKDDKVINYIFRTRTKTDEDGDIISAHYGRIRGEIRMTMKGQAYFQYWFNPDPQSRSLESNKKPY